MNTDQLKIIFTNGSESTDITWTIVERKSGRIQLDTECGLFSAQEFSKLFESGELVIDVNENFSEKFEELLTWINYQFLDTDNLFVKVSKYVDPDNKVVETVGTCPYSFEYTQLDWSDEKNSWIVIGVRERISKLPKSQIRITSNGVSVVPIWLIRRNLPNFFSRTVECVRLVNKTDLIDLMYSHLNKLLPTSN